MMGIQTIFLNGERLNHTGNSRGEWFNSIMHITDTHITVPSKDEKMGNVHTYALGL